MLFGNFNIMLPQQHTINYQIIIEKIQKIFSFFTGGGFKLKIQHCLNNQPIK